MSTKPNTCQITYDTGSNKQDLNNILDTVVPIADYTALRNYTGRATQVSVTADGIAGVFKYVSTDTTSVDNGGTIIVAGTKRWKRVFDGAVSVKWFGAVGNGVLDDTSAVQNACIAAQTVTFGSPSDSYIISSTIVVPSKTNLLMNGASVTQSSNQTILFDVSGSSGVTITGGRFFGKTELTYVNNSSSNAVCIHGVNVSNLKVTKNTFENFYYSPIKVFGGSVQIEFSGNVVKGPGSSVLGLDISRGNTTGATIIGSKIIISDNIIEATAQGVTIGKGSTDVSLTGNLIHNLINHHGIYVDTGVQRVSVTKNIITATGVIGVGIKVQCYDAFGVQSKFINVSDNIISHTGADGILIDNTSDSPTLKTQGIVISGNNITNSAAYGIDVKDAENTIVSGNSVFAAGKSGIAWENCTDLLVSENSIHSAGMCGIRDLGTVMSAMVIVKNNTIANCATSNTPGNNFGIFVDIGVTGLTVAGNFIRDSDAKMVYGIYIVPSINSSLSVYNNTVLQSTSTALRLGNTAALMEYRGNNWIGTIAPTFNDPALNAVSSASPLLLPTAHDVVCVSGTTSITSIQANGHSGRRVTLIFDSALTVVRGENLVLNPALGSFTTTQFDTLTLVSDGIKWYEVCRSVN